MSLCQQLISQCHQHISNCQHLISQSSSSTSYSHFYVGSIYDDVRLHVAWSYTSSPDSPFSLMSSFTLFNHLLLGLLLFLLPCTFISITLVPTQCSSLLITCPYHFNLLYWAFFAISPTSVVPLILSFLILSSFVSSHINRSTVFSLLSSNITVPTTNVICQQLSVHKRLASIDPEANQPKRNHMSNLQTENIQVHSSGGQSNLLMDRILNGRELDNERKRSAMTL